MPKEIKPFQVRTETPLGVVGLDYLKRTVNRTGYLRGWGEPQFTVEDLTDAWLQSVFLIPDLRNGGTGDDVRWVLDVWINSRSQFEFEWYRTNAAGKPTSQTYQFKAPLSFVFQYSAKQFARWVEGRLAGHTL